MVSTLKRSNELFLQRARDPNAARAALWLYLYALVPSLVFAMLFLLATSHHAPDLQTTIGQGAGQKNISFFPAVIFNPLVESLLLAGIVRMSVKFGAGAHSFVIAAIALAAMHSLANPSWGLTVFSVFLIQSYAFFHTYTSDFWRAWLVISLAHAMHNATVMAVLAYC